MTPLFVAGRLFNDEPVAAICVSCGAIIIEHVTYIDQVIIYRENTIAIWPAGGIAVVHECPATEPFEGANLLQFRTQVEVDEMRGSVTGL